MNKQRVFRVGDLTPGVLTGDTAIITATVDTRCPHPTRRAGALFAAPALTGSVRWVLGNDLCRYNTRVHELTVDADTTYVYEVRAWERASWNWDGPTTALADAYWASGMALTDWLARSETTRLDPAEWEVLIDPARVLSARRVSAARLLAAAPPSRHPELRRVTRGWRRAA